MRALRAPAQVLGVDVEDPGPGHGGGGGGPQVGDLKEQAHGGGQADALVAGQGQHLQGGRDGGDVDLAPQNQPETASF